MKKIFIIDTNVLLNDPKSVFKFEDNDVVIPISVIEEIDHFKKNQSETGRNAREVSRILDQMRKAGSLANGVKIFPEKTDSGLLFVHIGKEKDLLPKQLVDNTDNHILTVGIALQNKNTESKVIIITKDSNLRIKADAFGIDSEDFEADKVDISDLYTGSVKVSTNAEELTRFYKDGFIERPDLNLHANQFVHFEDANNPGAQICGVFDSKHKRVANFEPNGDGVWGIFPRNLEQNFALWALLNDKIKLVTLTGSAGTGKTLLAIAAGLSKTTDEDVYQKLLVARPIFALGKDIGFLPGDVDEKLHPWMHPIYDSLEFLLNGGLPSRQKRFSKNYQELISQGIVVVEPLTYIRGRSLPNAFFVVDESQNLTSHEIKTILTRAGEGTKIVLTGDPYQIDNPYIDSTNNGLTYVIEKFKHSPIAAHVTLSQGERSELATLAAGLL